MAKKIKICVLVLLCVTLSACGFQPRSSKNWPPQFHCVSLDMPSLNTTFATDIKQLIKSMHSTLVPLGAAPYSIKLDNIQFFHDQPPITTSNQPITFTYTFNIHLAVINAKNKAIYGPVFLSVSQPMIVNSDQIYSNTAASIVKPMLERRMVSLVYDHLTSEDLQHRLTLPKR